MFSDVTIQLSDKQKECLRLVGQGMSSKEIAIQTGLTPLTVDTYVKSAMARLGTSNRREAARELARLEASQESGSLSPAVAAVPASGQSGSATTVGGWRALAALPPPGGSWNEWGWMARTVAILKIAAISAVVVLALALLVAAAFRTFA